MLSTRMYLEKYTKTNGLCNSEIKQNVYYTKAYRTKPLLNAENKMEINLQVIKDPALGK